MLSSSNVLLSLSLYGVWRTARPPGTTTRNISFIAARSSATCSRTWFAITTPNVRSPNESLLMSSRVVSAAAGNRSALTYRAGLAFEILAARMRSGAKWRTFAPAILFHIPARSKYIKRCLSLSCAPHLGQEKFSTSLPITSRALIRGGTSFQPPRYGRNRPTRLLQA